MADINDKIRAEGSKVHEADFTTLFKKFHKDFNRQMDQANIFLGLQNEELIATRKRLRLQQAALAGITAKPAIMASNAQDSVASKTIVSTVKMGDKQTVSKLDKINEQLEKDAKDAKKASKEARKNSMKAIIQANLVQNLVGRLKEFFIGGEDDTLQIVNAVENVERAVRDQESIAYDQRTQFRKFLDQYEEGNGDLLGGLQAAFGIEIEQLIGAFSDVKRGGTFGATEFSKIFDKISPQAQSMMDNVMGKFGMGFENLKGMKDNFFQKGVSQSDKKHAEKKSEEVSGTIFDSLYKVMNSQAAKSESVFMSSLLMFGNATDIGVGTFVNKPIKTAMAALKTFKWTMGRFFERPVRETSLLVTQEYGAMFGLLAAAPLKIAQFAKNTLFSSPAQMYERLKNRFKKTNDEISVFSLKYAKDRLFTWKFFDQKFSAGFAKVFSHKTLLLPFKAFKGGLSIVKNPIDSFTKGMTSAKDSITKTSGFLKKHLFELDTSPFKKSAKIRGAIAEKSTNAMNKTTKALAGLVATIATFKNSVIFGFVLKKATTQFGKFKTFMGRVGSNAKKTTANLLESSSAFQSLRRRFEFLNPMVENLNDKLKGTYGHIKTFALKGLTAVKGFFSNIFDKIQGGRSTGSKLKSKAGTGAGSILAMIDNFTPKFLKKIGGKVTGLFSVVGRVLIGAIMTLGSGLVSAIFSIPALIIGALVGIGYLMYKNWDLVKEKWKSWIVEPFISVIDFASAFLSDMGKSIRSFFDPLFILGDAINTFILSTTGVDIGGTISGIFDSITGAISSGINKIIEIRDMIGTTVIGMFSGLWGMVKNAATKYLPSIITSKLDFLKEKTPAKSTASADKINQINTNVRDVTTTVNKINKVDRLVSDKKQTTVPVMTDKQIDALANQIMKSFSAARIPDRGIIQPEQNPDVLTSIATIL